MTLLVALDLPSFDDLMQLDFYTSRESNRIIHSSIVVSAVVVDAIWFGVSGGSVLQYSLDLAVLQSSIKAFALSITHIKIIINPNKTVSVLCIGYDELLVPLMKLFVDSKLTKSTTIVHGLSAPVNAFSVYGNLIAVGLESGVCLVIGNERDQAKFTKSKLVYECKSAITGVGFSVVKNDVKLFVATKDAVVAVDLNANDKDAGRVKSLCEYGGKKGCIQFTKRTQDQSIVVARDKDMCIVNTRGKSVCVPIEAAYKITVCDDMLVIQTSDRALKRVVVYDLTHNYIAFTQRFSHEITHVQSIGSQIILFSSQKTITLIELSLTDKIDILHTNAQYQLALQLLQPHPSLQPETHSLYAAHLYTLKNYPSAVQNYILSSTPPMEVIRKFLKNQKDDLCVYLGHLVFRGGCEGYTVLLVGCFVACGAVDKCERFIDKLDSKSKDESNDAVGVDVGACCKILVDAGWFSTAIKLCKKRGKYERAVDIMIVHLKDVSVAVDYVAKITHVDCVLEILRDWGDVLLDQDTDAIIRLAFALFSDKSVFQRSFESILPVLLNRNAKCVELLESLMKAHFNISKEEAATVDQSDNMLEHLVHVLFHLYLTLDQHDNALALLSDPNARYSSHSILVICEEASFKAGVEFVYQREAMYEELVEIYMRDNAYSLLFECLQYIEPIKREIWTRVLSFFANRIRLDEVDPPIDQSQRSSTDHMLNCIKLIQSLHILSPIQIVDALTAETGIPLSLVKPFLLKTINAGTETLRRETEAYEEACEESKRMEEEIAKLENGTVFQNESCSRCGFALSAPSVHFFCKHSYHKRCIGDVCMVCEVDNAVLEDLVENRDKDATMYESFKNQVKDGQGLDVLAEWFGRVSFN